MTSNENAYAAAVDAVTAACSVARAVQQDLDSIRQITKDDRSPVTVADYAVQAIVAMELQERLGDVKIVGEEQADALRGDEAATIRDAVIAAVRQARPDACGDAILDAIDAGDHDGSAASYWTVDPVDGTKGFLRGQQYAIALARLDDKQVTLGVMGCPNLPVSHDAALDVADGTGCVYAAIRGEGAWRVTADGRETIKASTELSGGVRACESVESSHSKQDDSARILDAVGGAGVPVRLDSQCKYAVVARGQADAYLRLPTRADYREKIWDHAAGMIVAQEAGAIVSDITGSPLDYGHGRKLETNRGVICASAAVHARIIEAIESLGIGAATAG